MIWHRQDRDRAVLVDAMRVAEVRERLCQAVADLRATLAELEEILPEEDDDGIVGGRGTPESP